MMGKLPIQPWSSSTQIGEPGHGYMAQVWDGNGKSIACIDMRKDAEEATRIAQMMSEAPAMASTITALRAEVERLKAENHAMSNALGYIVFRRTDGTVVISTEKDAFSAAKRWLDYRATTEGGEG